MKALRVSLGAIVLAIETGLEILCPYRINKYKYVVVYIRKWCLMEINLLFFLENKAINSFSKRYFLER